MANNQGSDAPIWLPRCTRPITLTDVQKECGTLYFIREYAPHKNDQRWQPVDEDTFLAAAWDERDVLKVTASQGGKGRPEIHVATCADDCDHQYEPPLSEEDRTFGEAFLPLFERYLALERERNHRKAMRHKAIYQAVEAELASRDGNYPVEEALIRFHRAVRAARRGKGYHWKDPQVARSSYGGYGLQYLWAASVSSGDGTRWDARVMRCEAPSEAAVYLATAILLERPGEFDNDYGYTAHCSSDSYEKISHTMRKQMNYEMADL